MMAATKESIRDWLQKATEEDTHMLVVCDTFDYCDYPVFVNKNEDINNKIKKYSENMQRVIEVYNLSIDITSQLNTYRVWNI